MADHKQGLTGHVRFQVGAYDVFVNTSRRMMSIHFDYSDGSVGHKSFRLCGNETKPWYSIGEPHHDEFMRSMPSETWKMIGLKALDVIDNPVGYHLRQRKQELGMEESKAGMILRMVAEADLDDEDMAHLHDRIKQRNQKQTIKFGEVDRWRISYNPKDHTFAILNTKYHGIVYEPEYASDRMGKALGLQVVWLGDAHPFNFMTHQTMVRVENVIKALYVDNE